MKLPGNAVEYALRTSRAQSQKTSKPYLYETTATEMSIGIFRMLKFRCAIISGGLLFESAT